MNEKLQPTVNIGGTIYTPINLNDVRDMIDTAVKNAVGNIPSTEPIRFIRGIHGLAKFLNISPSKAQEIKNSGKIPFSQNGRVLLFDPQKVLDALETPSKKRKA